jgi:hypothetical protein
MKTIFEASTGLEAHMIVNLLQQEGIDCRMDGEYLQGGVGELQAMNIVRVLVDDHDFEKARAVINEWDARQPDKVVDYPPASKSSGIGRGLLFGFLAGVGATFWAYNSPVTNDGIDYNNDGELDERWLYKDNRIYRVELDRNLDGKVDAVNYYNLKGLIYKSENDDNFDGTYETSYKYKQGNVYLHESDINQDGKTDLISNFENGMLTEVEISGPEVNSPRKKQIYEMNKLVNAEFDSNGDGEYEISYQYDFYEEIKSKSNNKLNHAGDKSAPPDQD